MKYVFLFILIIASFFASGLFLRLINPNDPEGSNLLVTTVLAAAIFALLYLAYQLVVKKHKGKIK